MGSQGIGFSIYDGDDWPYPEAVVGTCKGLTASNEPILLVVDSNTFRTYRLGVRDHWTDGGNSDYGGSDYEADVMYPEVEAPIGANATLKHTQSRVTVKPWKKEDGFRSAFNMDLYIRQDSEPSDAAITQQVPIEGQLVYDRHLLSPYLQEGVRLRGAPWRITKDEMWFDQVDDAAGPPDKLMSEMTWALEWSEPVLWVSRDTTTPLLNRATGTVMGGSNTGVLTGPDEIANSAVAFGINDSMWQTITDLAGDFTLSLWVSNPVTDPITLFQAATGGLRIILDSADKIEWWDNSNHVEIDFPLSVNAWSMITVQRSGNNVVVYFNGALVNTAALSNPNITYGGRLTICQGAISLFDVRCVDTAVSANGVRYLYNDVTQNNGNATCPLV